MKKRDLFRKLQLIAMMCCGILPGPALLFAIFCPSALFWTVRYVGGLLCLSSIALLLRGKWRLWLGVPAAIAFMLWGPLTTGEGLPQVAATAVVCGGLLLWSLQLGSWEADEEMPLFGMVGFFALHLVGQLALFVDDLGDMGRFGGYRYLIRFAFMGYLLLIALSFNRNNMNLAGGEHREISKAMRQKNMALTLGLFCLALGASFIPKIYDWLRTAILWLIRMLGRLLAALMPSLEQDPEEAVGGFDTGMLPEETTQTGLFGQILEILMWVIGGLIALILIIFFLHRMAKLVVWLLKKLWKGMGRFATAVAQDYEEEITDTRAERAAKRTAANVRDGSRNRRKQDLDPRQQVRDRYRWLLRKHRRWGADSTARENLPINAAQLYERARYSDHPVSQEDVSQFQNATKKC